MGKRRQALSENKVRIGKHDSDRLRAPLPHPTLMHTVKAKVQPPYALYMWCMLAWKCRKSMLSEWGRGGGGIVGTKVDVMELQLQRLVNNATHTFSRAEANKARAPSDVHNGDGGDDTVVHSAGQPSGPAHSSDKQQRTAHTALWSLHNAGV